jgi:hypothetical protein
MCILVLSFPALNGLLSKVWLVNIEVHHIRSPLVSLTLYSRHPIDLGSRKAEARVLGLIEKLLAIIIEYEY